MDKNKVTKEVRDRIEQYGSEMDRLSIGKEYDKLKTLLDEMMQFKKTDEGISEDARFNYYLGTGYGTYSDYIVKSGKKHTDSNLIDLRRWSMFYLRKAIALHDSTIHTDSRAQLRILTNYANGLDTAGRCIEALRIYRKVLAINGLFSIAQGNYGKALQFLANMVNDGGHCNELHRYAYQAIKKALVIQDFDMHEQATAVFRNMINKYEALPIHDILTKSIISITHNEKCEQIALVAIEIEKQIKELSEQELRDETIVKVILQHCFDDKEDISAMAKGNSLDKLVEKVMELIREVYL